MRSCKWKAIEEEFGEPIRDVIQGFRDDGNSWVTIAGALEITEWELLGWRRALGLPVNRSFCCPRAGRNPTRCDKKARAHGYDCLEDAIRDMRVNQHMTVRQVGKVLDIHYATIVQRTPPGAQVTNVTPTGLKTRMSNLIRRKPARSHPWRLDEAIRIATCRAHLQGADRCEG